MKKRRQYEISKAWAWEFDNVSVPNGRRKILCEWADPTRESLIDLGNKPSDEAIPVAVYIIRRKDYDARRSS